MALQLFIFLLIATSVWAAPAHDATTTGTATGVNTITVNHTVGGACANPIILVSTGWQRNPRGTLDTLTIGGVGGAPLRVETSAQTGLELWARHGVSTGSNAVVVTFDVDVKNSITTRVSSYCDTFQATPTGAVGAQGNTTEPTIDVTSASGELVVDAVVDFPFAGSQTLTVGAGQTQRANFAQDATNHAHGGSDEAGAASVTMSWGDGTDGSWMIVGVSLKPVSGGATRRPIGPIMF